MFLFSGGCPSAYIKQSLFIHSTSGNGGKPVKKIPASATVLPTMKVEVQSPYNRISISHNRKDNVAFPFGQSVKGFGKQFIFDEYIKAGHLKTEIIAFVFVRCEKLREFAFAQIRKRYFACCAFRKSAAVAFRFANQSFLC